MPDPDFYYYLITDRTLCHPRSLGEVVEEACRNGIQAVQLREKDLGGKALYEQALELRDITRRWDAALFINERVDIALATGADGVHCREAGMGPVAVKELDPSLRVGASVHSEEAAQQAEAEGADFLLFGPVYDTPSKAKYGAPQGTNRLRRVAGAVQIPVYAVGGITPERTFSCRSAGAMGVAGISSIMGAESVKQKVKLWEEQLDRL